MVKLEDLKPGLPLVGLEPSSVVTVAAVGPIGENAVQVLYRTTDGATKERLLGRGDEESLVVATVDRIYSVKEDMEKAEARRLQPYFVRAFFMKAFEQLGGSMYPREFERYEITHVPTTIRERDRLITGRNGREQEPVFKKYERICFERTEIQPVDQPGIVTVTLKEMPYAFNQGSKFILAIVLIGDDDSIDGPYYVRNPFEREPDWGVSSINYKLSDLLSRAELIS